MTQLHRRAASPSLSSLMCSHLHARAQQQAIACELAILTCALAFSHARKSVNTHHFTRALQSISKRPPFSPPLLPALPASPGPALVADRRRLAPHDPQADSPARSAAARASTVSTHGSGRAEDTTAGP
eukprot:scaffold5860_cov103-Isochrysis_galbana.AAC.7